MSYARAIRNIYRIAKTVDGLKPVDALAKARKLVALYYPTATR